MQNYNQTISSLVRIAQQLDEAGLYEQSDLVHESLLKIAQNIVKTKDVPFGTRQYWMQGENPVLDFFRTIHPRSNEQTYDNTRSWLSDSPQSPFRGPIKQSSIFDKFLERFSTSGEVSSEFIEYFLKSPTFRNELIAYLSGLDLGIRRLSDNRRVDISELKQEVDDLQAAVDFHEREFQNNPNSRSHASNLERSRKRLVGSQNLLEQMTKATDYRRFDMRLLLREISTKIEEDLKKVSNNFAKKDKISDILDTLKQLEQNGIEIPGNLKSIVETYAPESGAYRRKLIADFYKEKAFAKLNDNELRTLMSKKFLDLGDSALQDPDYQRAATELSERELDRFTIPQTVEDASVAKELSELEAKLGLSKENPNASQYPKVTEAPQVPQQQTVGDGNNQLKLFRSINKPTKSSQPKVQRVRFRSPGAGSSATTVEELFRLVQLKPDRWEQFNNNNKDPKLKLDEIKKLLKAIGAKMGKGSVTLSDVIKRINFNDPRLQLIEPAIEIAFNEFGKYLENPSSYSSNLKPNIDEIKKFFSPILAWQELVKNELKTKSVNELLKYFTNNNPSVSIQGPTSPGLTKGINAGPLFEIGYINYRFNDLSNKEKEDIIYMIKNGGNLPRSQSEIENEQREQIRKMQEKYPVSGQGDLRLQQQLQRNMMR